MDGVTSLQRTWFRFFCAKYQSSSRTYLLVCLIKIVHFSFAEARTGTFSLFFFRFPSHKCLISLFLSSSSSRWKAVWSLCKRRSLSATGRSSRSDWPDTTRWSKRTETRWKKISTTSNLSWRKNKLFQGSESNADANRSSRNTAVKRLCQTCNFEELFSNGLTCWTLSCVAVYSTDRSKTSRSEAKDETLTCAQFWESISRGSCCCFGPKFCEQSRIYYFTQNLPRAIGNGRFLFKLSADAVPVHRLCFVWWRACSPLVVSVAFSGQGARW